MQSTDAITCAQALGWFDLSAFRIEYLRIGKSGTTVEEKRESLNTEIDRILAEIENILGNRPLATGELED